MTYFQLAVLTTIKISTYPEDQPQSSPWLADEHGHVLTRKTKRDHTEEVQHPVYWECAVPVSSWIWSIGRDLIHLSLWSIRGRLEVDLQG